MKPNDAQTRYLPELQFETEVIQSPQPVLVAFETPWSQPCKVLDPVLQELERDCLGKLKVVRINADAALDLSFGYNIQSIPTLLYLVGGNVRFRIVGTATKEAILAKLKANGAPAAVELSQNGASGAQSQS